MSGVRFYVISGVKGFRRHIVWKQSLVLSQRGTGRRIRARYSIVSRHWTRKGAEKACHAANQQEGV